MQDDWYGHRDIFTWAKTGDKDEWLQWDHLLASALQIIEDHTDDHGLLVWETEDPAVVVDAVTKIDKFDRSKERKESGKNYKRPPGARFVPKLWSRRTDENGNQVIQTRLEWIQDMVAKEPD